MPRHYTPRPKLGEPLTRGEIDPVMYEYTLAATPSRHWPVRNPPPPGEVYSPVTVYDGAGNVVRRLSHEDLQRRPGVGMIRRGSPWVGENGWLAKEFPKKGKYVWTERG